MKKNPKKGAVETIKGGKFRLFITRQEIKRKYSELAEKIKQDFSAKPPPMIIRTAPKGDHSSIDLTRAMRNIDQDFETDILIFTDEPGRNPIFQLPTKPIERRHIILLQNIVATGETLELAKKVLNAYQPASISLFALGWKVTLSKIDFIDYVGFILKNKYYIGEGGGKYDIDQALEGLWEKIN